MLVDERMEYQRKFSKAWLLDIVLQTEQYWLRKYVRNLRLYEHFYNHKVYRWYYLRRHNVLGLKLGFFIHPFNFKEGLKIYHYGSIIIHPNVRVGKNCTLHGNCCLGTKGGISQEAPIIGDNVDIGQGAQILGKLYIADNVTIAAGAIVTKDISEPGTIVAGVPARVVGYRHNIR